MIRILLVLVVFSFMNQKVAVEEVEWRWSDEKVSIMHSLQRSPRDYEISITKPISNQPSLNVAISDGTETLCEFESHFEGAFAFSESGSIVVYSQHSPIATGCALVAYDLVGKKQLWTANLEGIGPVSHSKWRNRINLLMGKDRVTVFGDEGQKYIEVVSLKTGKTISHRTLELVQFDGQSFEFQRLVNVAKETRAFPNALAEGNDPGIVKDDKPWSGTFVSQSHKTTLIIEKYREGIRQGPSVGFHTPRRMHWTGEYLDGEKHGVQKIWQVDGRLHSTKVYDKGKLISEKQADFK